MVQEDRRSWLPAIVWSVFAAVSLAFAVWIAIQPGHLTDLHQVRDWLAFASSHSTNPYAYFDRQLDYPPIAFLVLQPLSWIPSGTLAAWFLPLSIAVTAAAGWVLVGAVAERLYTDLSTQQRVAIVSLILSGGAVRGAIWLGQTVALAVLFGALALSWSRRRPFAAGLMLALCSFKPHLAVGFGLAILLIDGVDVIVTALAIVISASLLVAAVINQSFLAILASYAHNLFAMYDGPDHIRGLLSVRWVIEELVAHYRQATLLYAAAAFASLALIGVAARRAPDAAGRTQVAALALLWPLLFLPSQLYNGILAAPSIWLLMWSEGRLIERQSTRLLVVTAVVAFGVLDVPRALRFLSDTLDDGYWLYQWSYYLSPLRLLLLFGFILFVAFRRARTTHAQILT